MNELHSILSIGEIHASRIKFALTKLQDLFPLNCEKLKLLEEEDLVMTDFLIYRFAKLQDYMGKVLIDLLLQTTGDYQEQMTIIDKVHKLEKLGLIERADLWQEMRRVRNHIAHEYPDEPALTAKYLNQIFVLSPELLKMFDNIKGKLKSLSLD